MPSHQFKTICKATQQQEFGGYNILCKKTEWVILQDNEIMLINLTMVLILKPVVENA